MTVAGTTAAALADSAADGAAAGTGFVDALMGAGSEVVSDAATVVGDTVMDGLSAAGSAVADAAVGVATDAAIGSGTVWGFWDGIHRILPSWVFTGGAAVLGSELAFAIFAFVVASKTFGGNEDGADVPATAAAEARIVDPVSSTGTDLGTDSLDVADILAEAQLALETAEEALVAQSSENTANGTFADEAFRRELLSARLHYDLIRRQRTHNRRQSRKKDLFHRRMLAVRIANTEREAVMADKKLNELRQRALLEARFQCERQKGRLSG